MDRDLRTLRRSRVGIYMRLSTLACFGLRIELRVIVLSTVVWILFVCTAYFNQ